MNEETTNVELMDDDLVLDPSDFPEYEDDGDHTEETEFVEEETGEEAETETIDTTETAETPETTEQPAETKPVMIPVKFMGEAKQLTVEEATPYIQKGMNYERVVQQRNDLQEFRNQNETMISDLGRIAEQFGMKPADLLESMETSLLRQQGKTDAEAKAIVRANKADRKLQAVQSKERQERQQQESAQQRQQRDVQEFVQKYPNMDYQTIPESVWDDVRNGETLVNAYGRYEMQQLKAENQRLQRQIEAQKQNDANKKKSLGSMKSGSQTPKLDDFLRGFNDD